MGNIPINFRFLIKNETGATIECDTDSTNNVIGVQFSTFYFLENGYLEHKIDSDISDNSYKILSKVKYRNLNKSDGLFYVETDASVSGDLILYIESSIDGETWPSDFDDFVPDDDAIEVKRISLSSSRKKVGTNFHL